MFEFIDVVIAGVCSTAISLLTYSSTKKDRNRTDTDLTDKQMRRQQKLAQRGLWEHAASAYGIAVFTLLVFNAATNMSHFPFWPRLIISLICFLAVLFILRSVTHALFRYYRNRLGRYS